MSDELMEVVAKAFPKRMFHRLKPLIIVSDKAEEASAVAQGYTLRYLHQEYPKAMYHISKRDRTGQSISQVVKSQGEEEALGSDWINEPQPLIEVNRMSDDITDRHVHYLQARGFRVLDVDGAVNYFISLPEDMQTQFLEDVSKWNGQSTFDQAPTEKKRKK